MAAEAKQAVAKISKESNSISLRIMDSMDEGMKTPKVELKSASSHNAFQFEDGESVK
jgi:hypothetical protein